MPMAKNKIVFNGQTLIDLTALTVAASDVASGKTFVDKTGDIKTGTASGGGLPTGIAAFDFGDVVISKAFTTTRQTFPHNLSVVPDLMIVFAPENVAQSYSMLCAIRGSVFGWRSSEHNSHFAYHGSNTTTTVTWTNNNNANYGISGMTENTFNLASHNSSYYWRAGTYKYIAIKFS